MTCPGCGAVYDASAHFCGACGTPLTSEKKGTHRVPILIMIALAVLGICVYFATGQMPEASSSGPFANDPWFTADNGNLMFDKYLYNGSGQLTVPTTVDGEVVVWIDDSCFEDCDVLTEIILPDTVEHIGLSAFANCDALRAIDLPPALITVGTGAFAGCDALEAIHIPASVNYIGWDAFAGCDALSYVFYDGTWAQWNLIFGRELGPGVIICCTDGNYSQTE